MSFWVAIGEAVLNMKPFCTVFADEAGVFYRWGKTRDTLDPGFYLKIPVVDNVRIIKKAEQVVDVPEMAVTTTSGLTYIVSGTISYKVVDADLALNAVYDYDRSLINLSARIIAGCVLRSDTMDAEKIIEETKEKLKASAEQWGIEILEFGLNQFAKARVIHLTQQLVESPTVS